MAKVWFSVIFDQKLNKKPPLEQPRWLGYDFVLLLIKSLIRNDHWRSHARQNMILYHFKSRTLSEMSTGGTTGQLDSPVEFPY